MDMEGIDKVLQDVYKVRSKQIERLNALYKYKQVLREKLNKFAQIQKVSDDKAFYNLQIGAVDSSYALQKNRLGSVEYYWVGVGMDLNEFCWAYDDTGLDTAFLYEEDSLENTYIMQGTAFAIEFSLASRLMKKVRHVFLDGSFLTLYLKVKRAYVICQKYGFSSSFIIKKFLEKYKEAEEAVSELLFAGSFCAVPKRSSWNELVDYISQLQNRSLPYRDAELVDILLEKGEFVEVTHLINKKKLKDYIDLHVRFGMPQKIKEAFLERFRLFYVKGAGGGVLRVESFNNERFPAEIVYSQNLTSSNELQIVREMDKLANRYLKILLSNPNPLGNYRLL